MIHLFLGLVLGQAASFGAPVVDAGHLLQDSDRSRGAAPDGIKWEAKITSVEDENETRVTYRVRVRGDDALAEALDPPRNRGELILFNDVNLWYFKPGLRKPVTVSPRQRLLGQISNGDIAATHYARDYDAHLAGEDTVGGKRAWILELKAKAKNTTYDRIRYWVDQGDRLALKAEFLTLGGQVFKIALFEYKNQVSRGQGRVPFISRMTITDARNAKNQTTLQYVSPVLEHQGASIFNVNNLIR